MKYNIRDIYYSNAEQKFMKEFEQEWYKILETLHCQQPQLLVGNRLRPKIVFWGYTAGKKYSEINALSYRNIAQLAVSIELLHKASLLFDDWIDDDSARHGEKAFHVEYGEHYTIVFALHLVGLAAQRIKKVVDAHFDDISIYLASITKILDTVYSMSLGALQELQLEQIDLYHTDRIKEIAQLETAEIIANSLQLGYLFSESNNDSISTILRTIGIQCGYLFQTLNDLEAFSNTAKNEQHKGFANFDIDNQRKNIVITMLWELAGQKERQKLAVSSGKEILAIAQKYNLRSFVLKDMENVYNNMIENIHYLSNYGVCYEWIEAFSDFMAQIRKIAYQRL